VEQFPLYSSFVKNPLICSWNPQNLSQPFHLKDVKTCFFILSECLAYTAVRCYRPHTSDFISRIFVEIGMLWLFYIFCSDAPIACPHLTWYTHHLLNSGTQGTGTYPPAPVAHSEWVCGTLYRRSPIPWSCRRYWVSCIYGWLGLGNPPAPASSAEDIPCLRSGQKDDVISVAKVRDQFAPPPICSPPWKHIDGLPHNNLR